MDEAEGYQGIQTRLFATLSAHFVLKIFYLSDIYTGRQILITSEG